MKVIIIVIKHHHIYIVIDIGIITIANIDISFLVIFIISVIIFPQQDNERLFATYSTSLSCLSGVSSLPKIP